MVAVVVSSSWKQCGLGTGILIGILVVLAFGTPYWRIKNAHKHAV